MEFKFGPIQTKWLESLEQHPERQMVKALGRKSEDSYKACCLGELGLIAGICEWDKFGRLTNEPSRDFLEDFRKVGLNTPTGGTRVETLSSLAAFNDTGKTWPEIAAIVRANPTAYFNKSV